MLAGDMRMEFVAAEAAENVRNLNHSEAEEMLNWEDGITCSFSRMDLIEWCF